MKKLLTFALAVLMFNLSVATASAQTDNKKADKARQKIARLNIGRKSRLDVKTKDGHEILGWLSDRHEDDFVITDDFNDVKTIKYSEVDKFVGKDLSTGAKIWIGIGVGFALAIALIWIGQHTD